MKRIISIVILTVAGLMVIFVQAQDKTSDKAAQALSRFESKWLIESLNGNKEKVNRIFDDDLIITPILRSDNDKRTDELSKMIDPALLASEMKVRISGNIVVLTNSTSENDSREKSESRNRSYHFLDTFNKRNGKWEIIATHFSLISAPNNLNDEQIIIGLVRRLNSATVNKDFAILAQLIGDDFVGIESTGKALNKQAFTNNIEARNNTIRINELENMKVKISGDMAVVTGRKQVTEVKNNGGRDLELRFTEVWTKRNDKWQIINYQVTSIS